MWVSGFTPHSLRHTYATIHVTNGADVEWLRRQMGHTSSVTSTTLYGRGARPKPRGALEAFEGAIKASGTNGHGGPALSFST